jgi:hypothetical protein
MLTDCLPCQLKRTSRIKSTSSLKVSSISDLSPKARLSGIGGLKLDISKKIGFTARLTVDSDFKAKENMTFGLNELSQSGEGDIRGILSVSGNLIGRVSSSSSIQNVYVDKFAGPISSLSSVNNFFSTERLYPISDVIVDNIVDKNLNNSNLFPSIDDGIFTGNYTENYKISKLISDDANSYIQPSSIITDGNFRYKFEVTKPFAIKDSFLFIRASAPISNYTSSTPPRYSLSNIKLEDPSGNLIIKYKDIILRGDSDYSKDNVNYTTYISEPEINNLSLGTWEYNYPLMEEEDGYTLNIDIASLCLDDPFDTGFNKGYEYDCVSLESELSEILPLLPQPNNSIRISSIEILNSGGVGVLRDNYVTLYSEVQAVGQRISRSIKPSQLLNKDFDTGIYPTVKSLWKSNNGLVNNSSTAGSNALQNILVNESKNDFIVLDYIDGVSDSGKLNLKFSHTPPVYVDEYSDGSFNFGQLSRNFKSAKFNRVAPVDNFFTVDSAELKITAKKAIGSRDYVIDVVGYSDDKLLNITSAVGGFLQNVSGVGDIPISSGFSNIDDLGISSETISDKSSYYSSSLTNNAGGDHYQLTSSPVVNSTSFDDYIIPLKIYDDRVSIGKSRDYSSSSFFENLYLDIFPIPSGASISNVELIVYYKPSNGLMLHTLGQGSRQVGHATVKIYPSRRQINDDIINTGPEYAPISLIEDIPHGYKTTTTLKTNYPRRWRGVDGTITSGPFDPYQFDFSFYNPQLATPFLSGYFSFNNDIDGIIISDEIPDFSPISGFYIGEYNVIKNIGLRFNSTSAFTENTPYTTIDWTSIEGYENDPLYGLISDSYDNAVRVHGSNGYINFGNIDTVSGFAIFARFSPDINMSGIGYNLWNSGIIFSKHDDEEDLIFALGYEDGYLTGYARDSDGNIHSVQDAASYDEYQYPLSVILTYNDNLSQKLKLYTDNEKNFNGDDALSNWNCLRDESSEFTLDTNNSDLTFGYSKNDNIGISAFITDIGISTYNTSGTNIVSLLMPVDLINKQMVADKFFETLRHKFWKEIEPTVADEFKLWQYIDEDTSDWHLGAFEYNSFSPAYDSFTKRVGSDYLIHRLKHDGSSYSFTTDLLLPSSVPTEGISYHSQIENDFLRFNLSDIPDANPNFISVAPRICKTLPRGYNFAERAMVVDTIIQHECDTTISWNDGTFGPKLIVSLYTKNQEPIDRPSKVNWGLINRHTHYLEISGHWTKLSSTFDFNDLIDTSEPWANFDQDRNISEFEAKYYSTDINDMFLQYDLVYPSGQPFDSKIKIHSATVRLEDALIRAADLNSSFNLIGSGEFKSLTDINLYVGGLEVTSGDMSLFIDSQPIPTSSSVMNVFCSGGDWIKNHLSLYVLTIGTIDSSNSDNYQSFDIFGSSRILGPALFIDGKTNQFDEQNLSLFTENLLASQTASGNLSLFTSNKLLSDVNKASFNMYIFCNTYTSHFPYDKMSLYTEVQNLYDRSQNSFNLYASAQDYTITTLDNSFNLYTLNYLAYNQELTQQTTIGWNNVSVGKSIELDDNIYATLNANDEIRGVDLICYGKCDNGIPCQEDSVFLHEQLWKAPIECIDGGIFRAKKTYTNLSTRGFNTDVGYSGHFYGIRKYTDLIPNAPYKVVITGKTGSTNRIEIPKEFEELNYPIEGFGQSGTKLIGDEPYVENGRQINAHYGKSVAVKKDLIAIGSPFSTVYDSNDYALENAGTIFLYRRLPAPSGNEWSLNLNEHKSGWMLEDQINLPTGYIRDYYTQQSTVLFPGFDPITERYWNVGQEGRQFGHSLDLAIHPVNNSLNEPNKQILVVGGPSSNWTRTFDQLNPEKVQIALIIFTDEFSPVSSDGRTYVNIIENIKNKDLIFKYFSDPSTQFDVKLIIFEPTLDQQITSLDFPDPKPTFITKKRIHRAWGNDPQTETILNEIKDGFHEAFPYDENALNNNIPPLLGFYVDNSWSLGKASLNGKNGGGAIDQFIDYYKDYSFTHGLVDFHGTPCSGAVTEFIPNFGDSENWIKMSIDILNHTLDTGRLVKDNQVRFITDNIGSQYFNPNLGEFNHIPTSGGRVYIFEKESGSWSLIQQIDSPLDSYGIPDRFGHAVAISDNAEVIAVGSPYIDNACEIYEYDSDEKLRLYREIGTWINYKSSASGGVGKYTNLRSSYIANISKLGLIEAGKTLYVALDTTERFDARRYLNISEYSNIKSLKYSSLSINGTWEFLTERFVPTPRLGYSVAVNDDGTIVAVGCPTDSLNAFDDGNVWRGYCSYNDPLNIDNINGEIKPGWISNTNAGSVRVLSSRNYYPHNTAVEYTKFGNLQQSLSKPEDSRYFSYLSNIFKDHNFYKTGFSDLDIPQEAGLAFIITPEIDAVSEEILTKITNWLALGDRNLVLVGNDPVWEENGIYSKSNDIINKILTGLNSRMRLHPARNKYEALVSGCSVNIMQSFTPDYSTPSNIKTGSVRGYGVGDIKMYFPDYQAFTPCSNGSEGSPINGKCELPLMHNGDLRAQWTNECLTCPPNERTITYPVNWPLVFNNFTPPCCISNLGIQTYDLKNFAPVPLLVAAEYSEPITVTYPAVPARYEKVPKYKTVTVRRSNQYSRFNNDNIGNNIEFIWSADNSNYTSLKNISNYPHDGKFFDPEAIDDRDSILQAQAISKEESSYVTQQVDICRTYAAKQRYLNTTSEIVLIAGVETESRNLLYSGNASDANIALYASIASISSARSSSIAQLNSWTNRTSFKDGFSNSYLYELFQSLLHNIQLNADQPYNNDICWVANPNTLPSDSELNVLKDWLKTGNKRLVITYDNSQSKAALISNLCNKFDMFISPLYLGGANNKYAESSSYGLMFNTNNSIFDTIDSSKINSYNLNQNSINFIPIKTNVNNLDHENQYIIAYEDSPITISKKEFVGYWQMKSGITKVTFPVVAGSGYKIFINTVSETKSDTESLKVYIGNAAGSPSVPYPTLPSKISLQDIGETDQFYAVEEASICSKITFNPVTPGFVDSKTVNVQIPQGISELTMYFDSNNPRLSNQSKDYTPSTVRLLSVSGVNLPVELITATTDTIESVFDGYETVKVADEIPERTVTIPPTLRPIQNDNTKYCQSSTCVEKNMGNQKIQDGPVVAAQEVESITSFLAGDNRSRITLLSDSSLVQGSCLLDSDNRIPENTINFLRSLYPSSKPFSSNSGRQFDTITKIVSPERGSPQKYFSISENDGNNLLFNPPLPAIQLPLASFDDKESDYDPRYIIRPLNPYTDDMPDYIIKNIKKNAIDSFISLQSDNGATAKFSGIIEGTMYEDAPFVGGMPQLMKDKGYDYLDFDRFPSGYPGDLFGYSIDLYQNKLIVGSPFSAYSKEEIKPWNYYIDGGSESGIKIGYNGGAGAAYIFEKTNNGDGPLGTKTPWEFIQKIRPQSINIGSGNVGIGVVNDQFGYDISIDGDIIVVGAPGHDFGNYNEEEVGSFGRKFFNRDFYIPLRTVHDLGDQTTRNTLNKHEQIINNGAVFTFENRIIDWNSKTKKWIYVEKSVPEGYSDGTQNSINDKYGKSVAIDKSNRTDADYTIVVGSPFHDYATSGNHISEQPMNDAGSAYIADIVLRRQPAAKPSPNSFINSRVFGFTYDNEDNIVRLDFVNNNDDNKLYSASGIIYSNIQGEIFLEASGQDPATKGFIQHRPYIMAVDGQYVYGTPSYEGMTLTTFGKFDLENTMNMFTNVGDNFVYNNVGLYTSAITGFASGVPSGLYLFIESQNTTDISSSLTLIASGIGSDTDTLNLRIRGK